jgi:hypothetical protein
MTSKKFFEEVKKKFDSDWAQSDVIRMAVLRVLYWRFGAGEMNDIKGEYS